MKNHHEELRWQKDDEIKWRMKEQDEPCDDLDGGSDEMTEEIWTPEKKRWKHLELEFIPHEQALKKKRN